MKRMTYKNLISGELKVISGITLPQGSDPSIIEASIHSVVLQIMFELPSNRNL